jgi:hypothetical protein
MPIGYKYITDNDGNLCIIEVEVHEPYVTVKEKTITFSTRTSYRAKSITPLRVVEGNMNATEFCAIVKPRHYKLGKTAHESIWTTEDFGGLSVEPGLWSHAEKPEWPVTTMPLQYAKRTAEQVAFSAMKLVRAVMKYGPIETWSYKTKRRTPIWPGHGLWELGKYKWGQHKHPTKRKGHKSMRNLGYGLDDIMCPYPGHNLSGYSAANIVRKCRKKPKRRRGRK